MKQQTPFDTTELEREILKELKRWYNGLDGEICGSDLSATQLWIKAIELTSQRLRFLFLEKAREFNGTIKTEEDLWEHIKRLEECYLCGREYFDKCCPNCIISKAEVDKELNIILLDGIINNSQIERIKEKLGLLQEEK